MDDAAQYTAGYRDGWDAGVRWGMLSAAAFLPDGMLKEQLRGTAGVPEPMAKRWGGEGLAAAPQAGADGICAKPAS